MVVLIFIAPYRYTMVCWVDLVRDSTFCFYFMNIILLSKFLELEVKVLSFNAILVLFVDFKEEDNNR